MPEISSSVFPRGGGDLSDELFGRSHEAAFDDAVVEWGNGRLFIAFDREAASLEEAIESATADIRRAGCAVKVAAKEIADSAAGEVCHRGRAWLARGDGTS